MWDVITYPFPNFNGATVEVWEWISNFIHTVEVWEWISNYIPHFIIDVITYPWCIYLSPDFIIRWMTYLLERQQLNLTLQARRLGWILWISRNEKAYYDTKRKDLFFHDGNKWRYFPRYWPFVRGINRSLVNSSHKGQWRGAFFDLHRKKKRLIKQS